MDDLRLFPVQTGALYAAADNDLEIESYDIVKLSGTARRTQDIIKILTTTVQSNPAYPTYGSYLSATIGNRDQEEIIKEKIKNSIVQAMSFLNNIENSGVPSEQLDSIVSLVIEKDKDPRAYIINLVVSMKDGSTAETQIPLPINS